MKRNEVSTSGENVGGTDNGKSQETALGKEARLNIATSQLELFDSLTTTGSISRVAVNAGVSPKTVKSHLDDLEARLGAKLFSRTRRGLILTVAGTVFGRMAREVLEKVNRIPSELARMTGNFSNEVRIGTGENDAAAFVWNAAGAKSALCPRIKILARSGTFVALLNALSKNEVDLAVLPMSMKVPWTNGSAIPVKTAWGLLVRDELAANFDGGGDLIAKLHDFKLLVPEPDAREIALQSWLFENRHRLNVVGEYAFAAFAAEFAALGGRVAAVVLNHSSVRHPGQGLSFVPLGPEMSVEFGLFRDIKQSETPASAELIARVLDSPAH